MTLDIKVSDKLAVPIFRAQFYLHDGKGAIIGTHGRPYKTMYDVTTTTKYST
jgi:hypothetical protein